MSAESKSKINQDQVDRDVRNQVTSRGRRPTPPPKIKQVRALIGERFSYNAFGKAVRRVAVAGCVTELNNIKLKICIHKIPSASDVPGLRRRGHVGGLSNRTSRVAKDRRRSMGSTLLELAC